MKTTLNEIVKVCGVVTSGDQRKHVLLASTCFFSLGFPSKLYLTSHSLGHLSFPQSKSKENSYFSRMVFIGKTNEEWWLKL